MFFSFALTINRFLLFIFPKINEKIFGFPEIYYVIAAVWGITIIFMGALSFFFLNFYDPVELHMTVKSVTEIPSSFIEIVSIFAGCLIYLLAKV